MFRAGGEIRNAVMPASSSKVMNTPFGIGLSITSLTTCASGMPRVRVQPWRHAWAARRLPAITPQRVSMAGNPARPAKPLSVSYHAPVRVADVHPE